MYGKNRLLKWAENGGVQPFETSLIGPRDNECCIDIRIGAIASSRDELPDEPVAHFQYEILPGEFILGRTLEFLTIPPNAVGILSIRSCWAVKGLNQITSVIVKPDWSGFLILELMNVSKASISLNHGDAIAQISLMGVH